ASTDLVAARDRIAAVEAATTPEQLGTTAADQINTRRLIVGRDAILTGTVDVAQLNVTESMSAEIVRAMTTESKRLIVTEDAILQRATVIENLVTPQLIAKRVDVQDLGAKLITSGSIQTDTAANRGVKINSAGINAWNASGVQSMRLNGTNNLLVGSFATAPEDGTGLKIDSRASMTAIDLFSNTAGITGAGTLNGAHGFITFSSPTSLGSTELRVGAMDRTSGRDDGDPAIRFLPFNKSIGFMGRFERDASGFKCGQAEHGGLSGAGYIDFTITYPTPFPSSVTTMPFVTVLSQNPREMSQIITSATNSGFKVRIVNGTSLATGYIWLRWMSIAW
ncbi:hypothetical protein PIB30_101257, partial [Stylosanthes scabra]|nr:hypothetical protein [Stylosanthes scabra]